jgi:hypothetical protein
METYRSDGLDAGAIAFGLQSENASALEAEDKRAETLEKDPSRLHLRSLVFVF